jgi:hypothetical protein
MKLSPDATPRTYVLVGAGIFAGAVGVYLGLPIETIVQILVLFGIGGILPSPITTTK